MLKVIFKKKEGEKEMQLRERDDLDQRNKLVTQNE